MNQEPSNLAGASDFASKMSSVTGNKKRPPKFDFSVQEAQQQPILSAPLPDRADHELCARPGECATSATCDNLDKTVRVRVGDRENILISPDQLIIGEQLGRGQYGIVEKMYHEESDSYFAVKRVALNSSETNEQTRLLMDVDILAKSTACRSIIEFYGALLWEGELWILMELMDCSLHKFYRLAFKRVDMPVVAETKTRQQLGTSAVQLPCSHVDGSGRVQLGNCDVCNPIPERVLGRIAADILNALSYLYSIRVIHRDLKPSNILINRAGAIKLCDFGISNYLVNSVARTYEAGCRPYMAPERIDPPRDRIGYDIKSDVWSFGITMLEIATGRYPYHKARDFFEQLKAICFDEPPKLTRGRFSGVFEEFIAQCLQKDYQLRPKFDSLESHQFIEGHRGLDIGEFAERVLANCELKMCNKD